MSITDAHLDEIDAAMDLESSTIPNEVMEDSNSNDMMEDSNSNQSQEQSGIQEKRREYSLIINSKEVYKPETLQEALLMLISSYFVFNLTYPLECGLFLEFFQMYFFEINKDGAKKSKSRRKLKTDRVKTLISTMSSDKINDMLSPEFEEILSQF